MAEGLCPGLCLLETGTLILSGSTAAFQELKGGVVFNKWATEKQALILEQKKHSNFFSVDVFHRTNLIGGGVFS